MARDSMKPPLFGLLTVLIVTVAVIKGQVFLGLLSLLFLYVLYLLTQLLNTVNRLADATERVATQLETDAEQ
ncbi:hypothetical protein [Halocatena halophila]|uniref:hypothetical protein n=1 Tax=Halocatena halophila TaxID=2814576 RepID=UPI002ED0AE4F